MTCRSQIWRFTYAPMLIRSKHSVSHRSDDMFIDLTLSICDLCLSIWTIYSLFWFLIYVVWTICSQIWTICCLLYIWFVICVGLCSFCCFYSFIVSVVFVMEKNDVAHPISTILDGTNYITWAHQKRSFFTGRKLWYIVTGDITKPFKTTSPMMNISK